MSGSIPQDIAEKIVNCHKEYLHHDITLMDTSCHIIACTDSRRVGDLHGASVRMFRENLDTLVVNNDSEYVGTRYGVNKMIYKFGKPVGVVGITGDVLEVEPFGEIIKNMTELLLVESERLKEEEIRHQDIRIFIDRWLDKHNNAMDPLFIQQGLSLGINILSPRRIVIMLIVNFKSSPKASPVYDNSYDDTYTRIIRKRLGSDYRNIWLVRGNRVILMLNEPYDEDIRSQLNQLREEILRETGSDVMFACDEVVTYGNEAFAGYERAMSVVPVLNKDNWIAFYRDVDFDLVLDSMQYEAKHKFARKVFKNCSQADIERWCELINIYAEENGSITHMANRLFMHKNTVQARILALEKQTGYDCRNSRHFVLLYIASRIITGKQDKET